jgi:2-oxoisovalerate dehydrogenase E1 component
VEVVDLRTIQPLDVETVAESVRRTHRLLVVDEGYAMFGVGSELAQAMNELCYDDLDGPVARLHTAPVPHPFAPALERVMLVSTEKIVERARRVVGGMPIQSTRSAKQVQSGRSGSMRRHYLHRACRRRPDRSLL